MKLHTLYALGSVLLLSQPLVAQAADYVIDTKGAHASIQFKASHLGFGWVTGRFNKFGGEFSYDESNPAASKISVEIDPSSVDSNHAERDKHLRSDKFLDVEKFSESRFVSTAFKPGDNGTAVLEGDFTLHGVTKPIAIQVNHIGGGKDPWGGYRQGFDGTMTLTLSDFGIKGPGIDTIEMEFVIEGIRQ